MNEEIAAYLKAMGKMTLTTAQIAVSLAAAMQEASQLRRERQEQIAHLLRLLSSNMRDAGHDERADEYDALARQLQQQAASYPRKP